MVVLDVIKNTLQARQLNEKRINGRIELDICPVFRLSVSDRTPDHLSFHRSADKPPRRWRTVPQFYKSCRRCCRFRCLRDSSSF